MEGGSSFSYYDVCLERGPDALVEKAEPAVPRPKRRAALLVRENEKDENGKEHEEHAELEKHEEQDESAPSGATAGAPAAVASAPLC